MSTATATTTTLPFQPCYLAVAGAVGVGAVLCDGLGRLLRANGPARLWARLRGEKDPGPVAALTERQRRAWGTAHAYHLTHAVALLAIAWLAAVAKQQHNNLINNNNNNNLNNGKGNNAVRERGVVASAYLKKGFWLVLSGAVGFATSIYLLSLGLSKRAANLVGPVTPTSGLILVLGWVNVGLAGLAW